MLKMGSLLRFPAHFSRLGACPLSPVNYSVQHLQKYSSSSSNPPEIPKNVLTDKQTGQLQQANGAIYDKKPFKITLQENKSYSWCLCGKSKSQPFCDGTHKNVHLKITIKPVRFQVPKTGDYWLCNCKQTNNRPFCDGAHKQPHIQSAVR